MMRMRLESKAATKRDVKGLKKRTTRQLLRAANANVVGIQRVVHRNSQFISPRGQGFYLQFWKPREATGWGESVMTRLLQENMQRFASPSLWPSILKQKEKEMREPSSRFLFCFHMPALPARLTPAEPMLSSAGTAAGDQAAKDKEQESNADVSSFDRSVADGGMPPAAAESSPSRGTSRPGRGYPGSKRLNRTKAASKVKEEAKRHKATDPYPVGFEAEGGGAGREAAAFAMFQFSEEELAAVLYIYELQVSEPWQGHGLGSWLLAVMEEMARENSMASIVLTVQKSNSRAFHFYCNRHGFQVASHSPSQCLPKAQAQDYDYEILSKQVAY